jgi:hypothetical protein
VLGEVGFGLGMGGESGALADVSAGELASEERARGSEVRGFEVSRQTLVGVVRSGRKVRRGCRAESGRVM